VPGYGPEPPLSSEKAQRERLNAKLRFCSGGLIVRLLGAAFFVWQDAEVSATAIILALIAAFCLTPIIPLWTELRRLGKDE